MQKKQNIFIAALIIMGIAVGLDLIFGTILGTVTPIVTIVFGGSYELLMIVSMLMGFISVYVSGMIAMIIYYKAISKTKHMSMWPVFVFPAAVALVLVFLSFIFSYGLGMVGLVTTIINFIFEAGLFWGAALLSLKVSKFNNQSVPAYAGAYQQQAPVYQQQAPVYQQPTPNYQQQAPVYQQPTPNYQQQAPVYQQPTPNYQQQAPVYQQPTPNYQQQAPVYQQPAPNYQQQAPVYQQPTPNYQQQVPVYQQPTPNYQQQDANYQQGAQTQQNAGVEDMDGLMAALLGAIKPTLKAPMTAVLCTPQELRITVDANGEYSIGGYVNSQNSYGAMISTDFTAMARYVNGMWMIGNVQVGVQNAKNYAKSFVANYIAISIFVAVMGGLGYLLLTLMIG